MSVTVLYDERVTTADTARVVGDHLWLAPAELEAATGWKLETEGLCRGDACVRVDDTWLNNGNIDLTAFARHMGQPQVRAADSEAWAYGDSVNARRETIDSTLAPDFTLPDMNGRMHSLSDFRGKKVFMFSWGSY